MKKRLNISIIIFLFFACSKEHDPEIIKDYFFNHNGELLKYEARMEAVPDSISFSVAETSKQITLKNTGNMDLQWSSATLETSILSYSPKAGTISAGQSVNITVTIDLLKLPDGIFYDGIKVFYNNKKSLIIVAIANISRTPKLQFLPDTLKFSKNEITKSFTIKNKSGFGTLNWTLSNYQSWISVGNTSGSGDKEIVVNVDRSGMLNGNYKGKIDINSNGGSGNVVVTIDVAEPPKITFISPVKNSVWQHNTQQTIKWTDNITGTLQIDLYKNNVKVEAISEVVDGINEGTYNVAASLAIGTDYKIRITNKSDPNQYFESELFNIVTPLDYTKYDVITDNMKTTFLNENFDNNDNNWIINTSSTDNKNAYISQGYYNLVSKFNGGWLFYIDRNVNSSQNFEIETSIKIISSQYDDGGGLIWGKSALESKFFDMQINKIPQYFIGYFSSPQYYSWKGWASLQGLNGINSENKLTVRKINNYYYFFINGIYVHKQSFVAFYGTQLGFMVDRYSTIHIDYFKINYLNL